MKKLLILVIAGILFLPLHSAAQGYNKKTIKAIKKAIGDDLKGYKIFSYPTDNFGVITSYESKVDNTTQICATWSCLGYGSTDIPTDKTKWINVDDYASVGGGAQVTLDDKTQKKLAVNTILPKIYNVIDLDAGLDKSSLVSTSLVIGKAYKRYVEKQKTTDYINSLENTNLLKSAYNRGKLAYVVADVVIEDLKVTVTVSSSTALKLDTKLSGLSSKVISDASLNVDVAKISDGTYTFTISRPVIFARLSMLQPASQTLETSSTYENWKIYSDIPDESLFVKK